MPESLRRHRPSPKLRAPVLALLAAGLFGAGAMTASAATSPEASKSASEAKPSNSELDAPLFYQLLVGELELSTGQAGVAYQVRRAASSSTW